MTTELLPCSFCKKPPQAIIPVISKFSIANNPSSVNGFSVGCSCGARGPMRRTEEEAAEAWNTRDD